MNAIKEELTLYKCSKCNKYYRYEKDAEKCCPQRFCEDCNKPLDDTFYYTVCDNCREKRNYNKCEHLTYEEYLKKYPKCMITYNDKYADTIEDLFDELSYTWEDKNDIPTYVYGTSRNTHEIDIDWAIESALEEAYEDAEFNNTDELYKFVNEWNKKNHIHSYYEANIVVFVPEDIRAEYSKMFE